MRKYFRYLVYLLVIATGSLAFSGAYDDFFSTIKVDDDSKMKSLLARGFDPNTPDPKGLSALYLAIREPAPKVARVLIGWPSTKVEILTDKGESPLMMAALRGELELAKLLIGKGAHVNKTGWTPLHYAATNGHLGVMRLLLDQYAYIDAESPNGTTPLMMAARYGTPEAVKLLLEEGADPQLRNQLGLTAIDFANSSNRKEVAELIAAQVRAGKPKGKW